MVANSLYDDQGPEKSTPRRSGRNDLLKRYMHSFMEVCTKDEEVFQMLMLLPKHPTEEILNKRADN